MALASTPARIGAAAVVHLRRGAAATSCTEPRWMRLLLIGAAATFLGIFLVLPLAAVIAEALAEGIDRYLASFADPDMQAAVRLTVLVAVIAVPANVAFGVTAAWLITRHEFRGKSFLVSLIDLPFSVSPVIAGLLFVLLFGRHGALGDFLAAHDLNVIFAAPGVVLATLFVTFPFVARELIPLMQAQGQEEEQAATVLGASRLYAFVRVTLPNIKWGLLYGAILCSARAMGEFGAVSVVSGHIRGETNTVPLHVEVLYNEFDFVGAFAAASVLALLALVTLAIKTFAEWRHARIMAASLTSSDVKLPA